MEYLYTLKLIPRLQHNDSWTDQDQKIVQEHFTRLKELTEQGIVILAGRTTREDPTDFGVVIFKAQSDMDAKRIMKQDPAVLQGIMAAELFPYRIALINTSI